jgi:hypothetical protein
MKAYKHLRESQLCACEPKHRRRISNLVHSRPARYMSPSARVRQHHIRSEGRSYEITFDSSRWAFGPLLWAPLSEVYGRKWPILVPVFISTVMSFGTAAAKDIQTVLITRFFNGFFGSAPITSTGAVFVDLWTPTQRGMAIVGYTFCVCGGPVSLQTCGGSFAVSRLHYFTVKVLTNPNSRHWAPW